MQGYPLHQCGLYAIKSRRQLAARLNRTLNFLLERADKPSIYRVWQESKSSGGYRTIEAPRDDLKAIQKRIADLLQRVLAPNFFCLAQLRAFRTLKTHWRIAEHVRFACWTSPIISETVLQPQFLNFSVNV